VDGPSVVDMEEEVADWAVEVLLASKSVPVALVWLELLVAVAVGTVVTTCGTAVVVVSACGVADAAAVVWTVLWAVEIPNTLSARLPSADQMSRD
jgi:hypothetical protein